MIWIQNYLKATEMHLKMFVKLQIRTHWGKREITCVLKRRKELHNIRSRKTQKNPLMFVAILFASSFLPNAASEHGQTDIRADGSGNSFVCKASPTYMTTLAHVWLPLYFRLFSTYSDLIWKNAPPKRLPIANQAAIWRIPLFLWGSKW